MLCVYCALLFFSFLCLFAIYLLLPHWANKDEYMSFLSGLNGKCYLDFHLNVTTKIVLLRPLSVYGIKLIIHSLHTT